MNIALWIAQGLLAAVFLLAGGTKVVKSKDEIAAQMGWANDFSSRAVKLIGVLEVLAAIALVLPIFTDILSCLEPLAGGGLALMMLGAIVTHARRREFPMIGLNAVLLVMGAFVAYGRF